MSAACRGCKRDERCLKRLIQKLLQRWRRGGGAAAETGAHDGTASTSERRVHTRVGVEHTAKARGAAPREQRDALGVRTGRRTASPPTPRVVRGGTSGGPAEKRYHVIRGNVSPSGVGITPLAPIAASRFHRSSALLGMKNAPGGVVGHFVLLAFRMAGYRMTASRRPKSRSCRSSPPSTSPAMSMTGCFHSPLFR